MQNKENRIFAQFQLTERLNNKANELLQISSNCNDSCREAGDLCYIIDLVKRIITVSLKTNELVGSLPPFEVLEGGV